MKFYIRIVGKIFFWEFLQNYPLLLGFTIALENAKQQEWFLMFLSSSIGSLAGSLTIRYTETNIIPGEKEHIKVTVTNMISFFVIAVLVAIYFAQGWGSWQTDGLLGVLIGAGVGYSQDLAAGQKKPGIRHILALTAAFIPALIAIRFLTEFSSPVFASLTLNTLITLIIVVIDYLKSGDQQWVETQKSQ
jgi:hypothetical protein